MHASLVYLMALNHATQIRMCLINLSGLRNYLSLAINEINLTGFYQGK